MPDQADRPARFVRIEGANQDEHLELPWPDFLMAKAQQNYVEVFYLDKGTIVSRLLRGTLTGILEQVPDARQVHRSYVVNLDHVVAVSGNSRKRELQLKHVEARLPLSNKYLEALQGRLPS